ncbi:MAG: hypothetical protein HYY24_22715 [Verrucomicrobia bacterium]|nr:hypothetical protein [Verrucomicrobiota bacterium]
MKITLPDALKHFVESRVGTGLDESRSEVVNGALPLLTDREITRFEAAFRRGEKTSLSPLTKADLQSVRSQIQEARAKRTV